MLAASEDCRSRGPALTNFQATRRFDRLTDEAEEIPPAVTVEHDAGPTQGLEAIEKDDADRDPVGDDGEPKLSDLSGLFA